MRFPSLGRLPGRPFSILPPAIRVIAVLALFAVWLGRKAPAPPGDPGSDVPADRGPRQPDHPRFLGLYPNMVAGLPDDTLHFLDTETGAVLPLPSADAANSTRPRCSPWRDAEGQFHMVASRPDASGDGYLLVRFTLPAGRFLGDLGFRMSSPGAVCWFPDRSDRILYAGADQRLYRVDLPSVRGSRRTEPVVQAIDWRADLPGAGDLWYQAVSWPGAPALDGWLLVSLVHREDSSQTVRDQSLWWLKLSSQADAVVAAERALPLDGPTEVNAHAQELSPVVGVARAGTIVLAYLALAQRNEHYDLWLAPVEPAAPGRAPCVRAAARRKLAEGCLPGLLGFSADARWLYTARRGGDRHCRVERFAVADAIAGHDRP
jgi:hypothetical protein